MKLSFFYASELTGFGGAGSSEGSRASEPEEDAMEPEGAGSLGAHPPKQQRQRTLVTELTIGT